MGEQGELQARKALAHAGRYTAGIAQAEADVHTYVDIPLAEGAKAADIWTWAQHYQGELVTITDPQARPNALTRALQERRAGERDCGRHDALDAPGGSAVRRERGVPAVRRDLRGGGDRVSEQYAARVGMARRVLDVVVASVALVLTAPVVLAAMVVIRMTSPGPALFRQERVGARGRPFTILKLRTMTTGGQGLDITMGGDARVTRVGAALRRTSLDELPQLVNVLRGEMTLVGPRPETVSLALRYPPDVAGCSSTPLA